MGELQYQHAPAGFEHALHGCQGFWDTGNVPQTEGNADTVKLSRKKGKRLSISQQHINIGADTFVQQARTTTRQHAGVDIGHRDTAGCTHLPCEAGGHIATAGSHVENMMPRRYAAAGQGKIFPQAVTAQGHQIVHQVIPVCDRGKDLTDLLRFAC